MRVNGGEMKGARVLILKLAMLHHRPFARNQLRNRIGKVGLFDGAHVTFEHSDLAATLGHD
jgi:hypothetical protein